MFIYLCIINQFCFHFQIYQLVSTFMFWITVDKVKYQKQIDFIWKFEFHLFILYYGQHSIHSTRGNIVFILLGVAQYSQYSFYQGQHSFYFTRGSIVFILLGVAQYLFYQGQHSIHFTSGSIVFILLGVAQYSFYQGQHSIYSTIGLVYC